MKGTVPPPPLEPTGQSAEEAEQMAGATGIKSEKKSAEGKNKNGANRTRDSGAYFESASRKQKRSRPCCAENLNFQDRLANRDRRKNLLLCH